MLIIESICLLLSHLPTFHTTAHAVLHTDATIRKQACFGWVALCKLRMSNV